MTASHKTSVIILVSILIPISILTLSPHPASAQGSAFVLDGSSPSELRQSTLDCASVGGSWSNATAVCTIGGKGSIASADSLTIDYGARLVIADGAVLTIESGAGITNTNGGTVENRGTVENYGSIDNYSDGAIINSGTLVNYGAITNNGSIANASSATIANDVLGTITNSGTITDHGTLANKGAINDSGTITSYSGIDEAVFFGGMSIGIFGGAAYSLYAYRSRRRQAAPTRAHLRGREDR